MARSSSRHRAAWSSTPSSSASTDAVGALLLGLFDDGGVLQHVGNTSLFTLQAREALWRELAPLGEHMLQEHPWRDWAGATVGDATRMPGAKSRWSGKKDLAWMALRPERVEVRYDRLQGTRFRHATTFLRWRPNKPPRDCRFDQIELTTPYELAKVFGA
jgi:ATP-dependent DNA ligase